MIKPVFCGSCPTKIVWLESVNINPKTNKPYNVPVEVSSLSQEDRNSLNRQQMINFDSSRHKSHFKNCPDKEKYSSANRERFIGYFVYIKLNTDNKIQSIISKDLMKINNLKNQLQKFSPSKIYGIGKQFKDQEEIINIYEDQK